MLRRILSCLAASCLAATLAADLSPWAGVRLLLAAAFLAACALAIHRFGGVAFVLVAGFVSALIQLPLIAWKAVVATWQMPPPTDGTVVMSPLVATMP